jgi:YegS/Rv2252/BmrU family lipid kinase
MKVAVIAHAAKAKSLGDGLPALREALAAEGFGDPIWAEVCKFEEAAEQTQRAVKEGADVVFVWGGDGTVRSCVDVLAGSDVSLAILPAGTANLFATNLGIPADIEQAVAIGLRGRRRVLDVGRIEGERFAVMAGAGWDAEMLRDADMLKRRIGRAAYLWSGTRNLRGAPFDCEISVDGADWFEGGATCVLAGNLGAIFGGVEVFPDAEPDDGLLEFGVVTADGLVQWARTLVRTASGDPARSPFVRVTKARSVKVELSRKVRYELDGGDRSKVKSFEIEVEPGALSVCVPAAAQGEH